MDIVLNKVIPTFLEPEKVFQSSVWGQQLIFEKGKHYQITAPSGSGKTSLVHFLYCLRKDYSGTIQIGNIIASNADDEVISSLRINNLSIVFQDLRLFPQNTLKENLTVKKALGTFAPSADAGDMMRRLGIFSKMEQRAIQCSYGEQQRAAIVRALLQPFDFLILDEPFSHLDNKNRERAAALISEEVAKRNASVIMIDLHSSPFFNSDKIITL